MPRSRAFKYRSVDLFEISKAHMHRARGRIILRTLWPFHGYEIPCRARVRVEMYGVLIQKFSKDQMPRWRFKYMRF
jgi:hypothetical protein